MEEDLRALLRNDLAVSAIVGLRVDWGERPQGERMPAIALHLISGTRGITHAGPEGLQQARVQADCYASGYSAARALAHAVIAALHGHRGGRFRGVFLLNQRDSREGGSNEADRPFRASLDFETHWSET